MKLNKRNIVWMIAGLAGAVFVSSCTSEGNDTGIEYAPNMYNSNAYEAYTQRDEMKYNPNGMTMRLPVEGTIARGQMDYTKYEMDYEGSASWQNPVAATHANVDEDGKALYMTFCQHCHGKTGKNDGKVVKLSEFPPPPFENFQSQLIQDLPIGKVFHTITFGKGMMGSHASQLSPEERWKVAMYVKNLSLGENFVYVEEDVNTEEAVEADTTATTEAEAETHDADHGDDNTHENEGAH